MEQNGNTEQQQAQQQKKPSTAMKITVLVVLIVLLAAGILLPIKLVPNAVSSIASSISSFFVGKEDVKLSTDKTTINSGEQFTLKWTGKHKTDGTYTLSYECATGARLETSINQPNETIACGSTYYFAPNDNTLDMTAITEGSRYTDIKITLGFLQNGASTIDNLGDITVTVTNPNLMEGTTATSTPSTDTSSSTTTTTTGGSTSNPSTPSKPKPTTSGSTGSTTSHPVSNPNGKADLEARAVAVGYLSDTGVFVPSNSVSRNQQAAIKFQVVNVGDKNSGSWDFTVDLPSETDPRYVSGAQQNLGPGDRIEYVLGFKNLKNLANNVAIVTVDPSNFVVESNEANNFARMNIVNSDYATANGKADLVVHMLDTGIVNKSTNVYSATSVVNTGDRVGVRFEVENTGAVATGAWKFQASLPTSDASNASFNSDTQPSLNPGEKRTYTLSFENVRSSGTNTITVTVDSNAQVSEINENNTASINFTRN